MVQTSVKLCCRFVLAPTGTGSSTALHCTIEGCGLDHHGPHATGFRPQATGTVHAGHEHSEGLRDTFKIKDENFSNQCSQPSRAAVKSEVTQRRNDGRNRVLRINGPAI